MIIRTLVQLKGDLVVYRNALTTAVKAILTSSDDFCLEKECFFLLQMAEYISSFLDDQMDLLERRLKGKGGGV